MGMTHDVKSRKPSKNGAATDRFQFMTFLRVEAHNRTSREVLCYQATLNDLQK